MRAVLIGFGSIGKRHATALNRRFSPLVIVDGHPRARSAAQKAYPHAMVLTSTQDLWSQGWDWSQTLVVIATWGPSHFGLFNEAADRGVRHIICEKPLSTSISAGRAMVERARQDNIVFRVNHTQRFLGVAPGLVELAKRFSLGSPQSIVVHGGASGLVTNGIHFIDLAITLFGSTPTSVLSTAFGEAVNPRSPDFMFYRGTAVWSFDSGREAVISLSNASSVFPTMTIYYQHAVINLHHHKHVVVMGRDPKDVAPNQSLTRTGLASEILYSGEIPGVLETFEDAFLQLYDEVASYWKVPKVTFSPESALDALQACIGALISGERKRPVSLPIGSESQDGRKSWPIS